MKNNEARSLLRELVALPGGATITCAGSSMEPTVCVGDKVQVESVCASRLRVGDVVLFEGANHVLVLHRILFLSPRRRWFLHAGDAPSQLVARRAKTSQIIGRASLMRTWHPGRSSAQIVRGVWASARRKIGSLC